MASLEIMEERQVPTGTYIDTFIISQACESGHIRMGGKTIRCTYV